MSPTEAAPSDLIARLESGESPALAAKALGLDPAGLVQAVARIGLGDPGSEGPSLVQVSSSRPKLEKAVSEGSLASLFPASTRPSRLALSAGLLQILDFWYASHAAAQQADDLGERATAAYWHLVAHRREPDPGNALYWARRVGRHPIHDALAAGAKSLPEGEAARVISGGLWSASGMIDLTSKARPGSATEPLARRLQRTEMALLLDASLAELSGR